VHVDVSASLPKQGLNKTILLLAAPLIFQNLSYTLLGVTDTFFVAQVSTEAVAAVGLAGVMFFSIMMLFRSTANSSIVFVGRAHGAKDDKAVGEAVWNVLNMVALLSLVALTLPWVYAFLFSFAAPDDGSAVRELGTTFLQIRAFEVPFAMFSAVVWGFLVGRGDSRTPMLLAWMQVLLNIVLCYLLVPGNLGFPALGVAGSAYATLTATATHAVVSAMILWNKTNRQRYGTAKFRRASLAELREVVRIGLPMGAGDFFDIAAFSVFFAMVGRLGTSTSAANYIALQYMSISFTMGVAIGQACSSLVAQFLGAKNPKEAERAGYRASWLAMVVMGLVGLGYLVAPAALMGVFSDDATVIAAGVTILKLVALYQVIDAVAIVLGGALNGAGDTTYTMVVRGVLAWVLFLPVTYVLIFVVKGGIGGAWAAACVYLIGLAIAYFFRFRSGRWKLLELR
jgi:multidrug resistance protein, MATE family